MRLLPEADSDPRLPALMLLLAVLGVVYLLGVHWWFVAPHLDYFAQMHDLREQELKFRNVIEQRAEIERRLADVREYEQNNQAFLPEADFAAAAASMTQRLKQLVAERAPDPNRCQLISNQDFKSTEKELYERVTIKVRMRCDIEQFAAILHDLEAGSPLYFLDELMIYKQTSYQQPGQPQAMSFLDIRFDVSGYLRAPGSGAAP